VGIELRFGLRHGLAGIDVWFWREASLPIWEQARQSPNRYNDLVSANWSFEQIEGRTRVRMFLDQPVANLRNEAEWPEIYRWIGEKLSLVYERLVPNLREAMDRTEAGQ